MPCCLCYDDVATVANPCAKCTGHSAALEYCEECKGKVEDEPCPFCRTLPPSVYRCPGCKMIRNDRGVECEACNGFLCRSCSLDTFHHGHRLPPTSVWTVCFRCKSPWWKLKFFVATILLHATTPWIVPIFYYVVFMLDWTPRDKKSSPTFYFLGAIFVLPIMVTLIPLVLDHEYVTLFSLIGTILADCMLFGRPKEIY